MQMHFTTDAFPEEAIRFFWSRVEQTATCWNWHGSHIRAGYGHVNHKSLPRRVMAHRFSWELHYGYPPGDLLVCHHCDNPPCVRPDHLFLGTLADNYHDCATKGRHPHGSTHYLRLEPERVRGERNPAAKLTEAEVFAIRTRRAGGARVRALAKEYGVSESLISAIFHGKVWT